MKKKELVSAWKLVRLIGKVSKQKQVSKETRNCICSSLESILDDTLEKIRKEVHAYENK